MNEDVRVIIDRKGSLELKMFGIIMKNIDGCEIRRAGEGVTISFTFPADSPPKVEFELRGHSFALEAPDH